MLERLLLAFIAGAAATHWLTKRQEDDTSDFEAMMDQLSPTLVNAIHAELAGEQPIIVSFD